MTWKHFNSLGNAYLSKISDNCAKCELICGPNLRQNIHALALRRINLNKIYLTDFNKNKNADCLSGDKSTH